MIGHCQMLCQTWSQEDEPSIYMQNVFNLLKYLKLYTEAYLFLTIPLDFLICDFLKEKTNIKS